MIRILIIVIPLLIGLYAMSAQAQVVENLYQGRVAMSESTTQSQRRAERQALEQVLVKVRGQKDVLEMPSIRQQLQRASEFLRQFRFEMDDGQRYYVGYFDQDKVNDAIFDAQLPIWDKRRPAALIWVAGEDEQGDKTLWHPDEHREFYHQLKGAADTRGVPLRMPLMDITDLSAITEWDVWGGFIDHIVAASSRYQVPVVMSVRVFNDMASESNEAISVPQYEQDVWHADWQLAYAERQWRGRITDPDRAALSTAIIAIIAEKLSEHLAGDRLSDNFQPLEFVVTNMDSLAAYEGVRRTMASLALVSDITLKEVQGTRGVFVATLKGLPTDVINSMSLEPQLQRNTDTFGQPLPELEYRWMSNE